LKNHRPEPKDQRPVRVAIGVGSNVGRRSATVALAAERLASLLTETFQSTVIETEPEGEGLGDQPLYLNAVVVGQTTLAARDLLNALLDIEREFGRERPYAGAPRTLDLDLLLFGDAVIDEPGLQVPHPRFRDRFFVLGPLAEIGPDFRDPVTGLTVSELLRRLLRDESR
jgi:2-amino-4-hydroxy-6-hydroxymethyldihydropteridine diphosphokinase